MQMSHIAYLLTGSNQGDRAAQLSKALELLERRAGRVVAKSSIYETASWGIEDLPTHYNQALMLHTDLTPNGLLNLIHQIENELGRRRQQKWGLRAIDIDIIYFDDLIIREDNLHVPHPLLQDRRFALAPIAEIAPDFMHPVLKKTNLELLETTADSLPVKKI